MVKKIYIIAGEDSGDNIGSYLIEELSKHQVKISGEIFGIGGHKMATKGLKSLFPIKEISIMGFLEIIPKIPKILKLINLTVADILEKKPDALITIDSPGFNLRVAKKVKKLAPNIKLIHYVAPTVWAYKERRAEKFAKIYHILLLLLPFEKPYFDRVGLKSYFVGHPIWENEMWDEENIANNKKQNIISFMLGSRVGEVKRHLKIFKPLYAKLKEAYPNFEYYLLATENTKNMFAGLDIEVVVDEAKKMEVISNSKLSIVKSGTGTLEFVKAKTPIIVFYKANKISVFIVRLSLKIKFANLINITLNKMLIPEFIQEQATVDKIFSQASQMLSQNTYDVNDAYKTLLSFKGEEKPSKMASKIIMENI